MSSLERSEACLQIEAGWQQKKNSHNKAARRASIFRFLKISNSQLQAFN